MAARPLKPVVEQLALDLEPAGVNASQPMSIRVANRTLQTTAVFDTYWRFAAERHRIYLAKLKGHRPPWTVDPIISSHRFTNCYRASDRVSQYLIREVQYKGSTDPKEVVFRTLLFKFFNKIETWEKIARVMGTPETSAFDLEAYDSILTESLTRGERIYSAAYVIPPPRLGAERKHLNQLRLLDMMLKAGIAERVVSAPSLEALFNYLLSYPAIGQFLGYQLAIDLNYSECVDFSEMEFVVAGPGARDGIRKCFGPNSQGIETDIINYMVSTQHAHFERLGLKFEPLGGVRPLQPIDCQNLFCEVDKYARVAHPLVSGISGRTRIKQSYKPRSEGPQAWFPPKWGIPQYDRP